MSRFLLGIAILLVFLLLGFWVSSGMNDVHLEIADNLALASQQILSGNWEQGVMTAKKAEGNWEKSRKKTACVADHAPMDEIDGLFAQLSSFEKEQEVVHYAATCAQLSKLAQAMADAHRFSWWNLL